MALRLLNHGGSHLRSPLSRTYTNTLSRCLSTAPPNNDKEPKSKSILSQIVNPQTQGYFVVAGGTLGTLLVGKAIIGFTSFFTHLAPTVVAKYGFYTGFTTATVMGGLALFTADTLTIRADPVFKHCLHKVQVEEAVQLALGDGIVPGKLRSYRLDAGKFEATSSSSLTWRHPRIQMIFDVQGQGPPFRSGIVTAEAKKVSGSFPPKLRTTILKIDYETGDEGTGGNVEGDATIWIRGSEGDYNRVSSRSGLALSSLASNMHINKAAAK